MSGLLALTQIAHHDLYRLAMDGINQHRPMHTTQWEAKEKGSLAGVLDAYAFILPKVNDKQRFHLEDVLIIHHHCMHNIQEEGEKINESISGRLRTKDENIFYGTEFTYEGRKAFIEEETAYWRQWFLEGKSVEDIEFHARVPFSERQYVTQFVELLKKNDPMDSQIEELKENLACGLAFNDITYLKGYRIFKETRELAELITHNLTKMYDKLAQAPPRDENLKLLIICEAMQKLERIHPFNDGNCRTFCNVLLNGLLMQQGFPPAILENPNHFDSHSLEELVEEVKAGMNGVKKLIQHPTAESQLDAALPLLRKYACRLIQALEEQQEQHFSQSARDEQANVELNQSHLKP